MIDESATAIRCLNPPELGTPPAIPRLWMFARGALSSLRVKLRLTRMAILLVKVTLLRRQGEVFREFERCPAISRLHGKQFGQADRLSPEHG